MGEYAEYALAAAEDRALFESDPFVNDFMYGVKPTPKQIIWTTKDGTDIDIKDMSISHIQNSIAKCKRDNWRIKAIPYLEAELQRRTNDLHIN